MFFISFIVGRLSAKDLVALLKSKVLLGASLASTATEDQLGVELPVGGDLPGLGNLVVNEGVVVLEVGAQALGLKGGPDGVLQNGIALRGPAGEAVGVDGELGLEALDNGLVLEEQNLYLLDV